jgi:hypothetical protein
MTKAKVSYCPLLIHKSNVAMVVGDTISRSHMYKFKHLSTMVGRYFSTNAFQVGNTSLESSLKANLCIQAFSQLLKRKYPLAINNIKFFRNNF